eukprot:739547-Prymnesium_polylepis.1
MGVVSKKGHSRPFDQSADGYSRCEACSVLTLACNKAYQPQTVLCGSAVRHHGRSASLTAPNGSAQQGLLQAVLSSSGTAPEEVVCNEAASNGSPLGDPVEVGALRAVRKHLQLLLSGVKGNCGHAEPGSGLIGLLRLLASLSHAQAAPNAQLRVLNSHIGSDMAGLKLPTGLASLESRGCMPYTGGVSAFGFSGTIAHVIIRQDGKMAAESRIFLFRRTPLKWWPEVFVSESAVELPTYLIKWQHLGAGRMPEQGDTRPLLLLGDEGVGSPRFFGRLWGVSYGEETADETYALPAETLDEEPRRRSPSRISRFIVRLRGKSSDEPPSPA